MLRKTLPALGLVALVGCADVTEPTAVVEVITADAPNNKNFESFSSSVAFAMLGPEFTEVCLVLSTDDPGNGDVIVGEFDEDGLLVYSRQSTSGPVEISVFASVADYVNGTPYVVAQGNGIENGNANGARALRGQGVSEDGRKVNCSWTLPADGSLPKRKISVR